MCSYSGGSEELSDDITQQQLLPGVKYVNTHPPISIETPAEIMMSCRLLRCFNVNMSLLSSGIQICGRWSARCVFFITVFSRKYTEKQTHTYTQFFWHVLSHQIGEERATAIALMRKFIAYQFTDTVRNCSTFYYMTRLNTLLLLASDDEPWVLLFLTEKLHFNLLCVVDLCRVSVGVL